MKIMFITCYAVIFSLMFGTGFSETKTLQQHTMEWEHQEKLFADLIAPPYNSRLRPFASKTTVAKVNTSIYLYSMFSIDEIRADYTMQILYREAWYDERLEFDPDKSVQIIVGDNWHAEQIWTPSVHVANDRDIGTLGRDMGRKVLLHIYPDGKVLLSKRVKLRPFCKMEFYRYPMDKQQCTLEIESSILPTSDMILAWEKEKPIDLNRNFLIPGFILTNYSLEEKVRTYEQTGNFSRITVRFDLQREFGHFVLDIYIPSILFVVTSWLSFWVEIPAAPARVTLGMTTMLTLVTSEKAIREKLPKVSYVHALDIWNVVCTGFVFASLVEYALVNYIYHKDKRRRKNKGMKRAESTATFSSIDSDGGSNSRMYMKKEGISRDMKTGEYLDPGMPYKKAASFTSLSDMQSVNQMEITCGWPLDQFKLTPQDIANGIDRKCRYIFPIGFMVFNVIYWLVLWL